VIKGSQSKLSESEVWDIFGQIIVGLNELHRMGIYHRDIKSANIFLNKDNVIKVGDLNVSKIARKGNMA
jgi:NIMA (never in mitosis gene a)-related kinase